MRNDGRDRPRMGAGVREILSTPLRYQCADENSGSLNENRGRWWGPEFCPIPPEEQPIMDGCYYCGRPVRGLNGEHDHTMVEKEGFRGAKQTRYSCVCENC